MLEKKRVSASPQDTVDWGGGTSTVWLCLPHTTSGAGMWCREATGHCPGVGKHGLRHGWAVVFSGTAGSPKRTENWVGASLLGLAQDGVEGALACPMVTVLCLTASRLGGGCGWACRALLREIRQWLCRQRPSWLPMADLGAKRQSVVLNRLLSWWKEQKTVVTGKKQSNVA